MYCTYALAVIGNWKGYSFYGNNPIAAELSFTNSAPLLCWRIEFSKWKFNCLSVSFAY